MNEEVKKQLEAMADNYALEWTDDDKLIKSTVQHHRSGSFMAEAKAAWELATKPTNNSKVAPETKRQVDVTGGERPAHTEDDERDAKEEFSAPHDGYAHGGLGASQTGYRSECARCRWLFDDVVPPSGDPTPLGFCGFKLTRIRKLFYDAGRRDLREAVAAAVKKERDRCIARVERIYADTSTGETVSGAIRRCKYAILNPSEGGRE